MELHHTVPHWPHPLQGAVLYYGRERYYRHMQTSVLEAVKAYGPDPVLTFWKAFGIIMEGEYVLIHSA